MVILFSIQTMETRIHLMVRMAFWPMLIPLVRVCREMPTSMTMSTGLWEQDQVSGHDQEILLYHQQLLQGCLPLVFMLYSVLNV